MPGNLPYELYYVQSAETDYDETLTKLRAFRAKESWWGYQSATTAFCGIVSKAKSVEIAESTCKYRGREEGKAHNISVAKLIFKIFEGTGAIAVPIFTKLTFMLRTDRSLILSTAGLIRIGKAHTVSVLIRRAD